MSQAPGHKFLSLQSINIVEPKNDFKHKHIGFFDERFGIDTEPTYKSEGVLNDGTRKFDDTYLEGKNCVFLHFKHRWLGNGKLARYVSRGHYHTKCFVSNNDFSIRDCANTNKKGDIFLYANLVDDMPIVMNDYKYSLYVIEPMLTPAELGALALNVDNVYQWKTKLEKSSKWVATAQANEVLAISMMSEAVVAKSIYGDYIQSLTKLLNQAQDKLLQTTGEKFSVVLGIVDKIEEEYDIGIVGDEVLSKNVQNLLKRQKIELKTIEAMAGMDGSTTESMKRQIFDTTYRFLGGPTMREYLNMVEGKTSGTINTPAISVLKGLERMNLNNLEDDEKKSVISRALKAIKSKTIENKIKGNEEDLENLINNAVVQGTIELADDEEQRVD